MWQIESFVFQIEMRTTSRSLSIDRGTGASREKGKLFLPIPFLGEGAADRTIADGRAWAGVTLMSSGRGGAQKEEESEHTRETVHV